MTYGELAKTKTTGFTTNHVIDDVVNNARWAFGRDSFSDQVVSEHELAQINHWAAKEGVEPTLLQVLDAVRQAKRNGAHTCDADCAGHINPETGECAICHVYHDGGPCPACGGRGYHKDGCPDSDAMVAA